MYTHLNQQQPDIIGERDVTVELKGGATFNPARDVSNDGRYIYVLWKTSRTRPTRVLVADTAPTSWRLGSTLNIYDGSSLLGKYVLVGLRDTATGEEAGDVPDRNDIKHNVIVRVW